MHCTCTCILVCSDGTDFQGGGGGRMCPPPLHQNKTNASSSLPNTCVQNDYIYHHRHAQTHTCTHTHTNTHRHVDLARRHHTHRLQLRCFSSWLYLTQSSQGRRRAETEARQHQMKMAALLQAAAEGKLTSDRETANMR